MSSFIEILLGPVLALVMYVLFQLVWGTFTVKVKHEGSTSADIAVAQYNAQAAQANLEAAKAALELERLRQQANPDA